MTRPDPPTDPCTAGAARHAAPDRHADLGLPDFSADVLWRREAVTVVMRGGLDLATVAAADRACEDAELFRFTSCLLDLRELSFIDARGVRLLIELEARSRTDECTLLVVPPDSGAAARTMDLLRLDRCLVYIGELVRSRPTDPRAQRRRAATMPGPGARPTLQLVGRREPDVTSRG